MQILLTRKKKFNIHNLTELNKCIKDVFKYVKTYWEIDIPVFNQEDPNAYFRIVYDRDKYWVYIDIDAGVWTNQTMTEWQLSQILADNILKYDN